MNRYFITLIVFLFVKNSFYSQCSISVTSTNGWTANITYSMSSIALTGGSPYQWYYQYAPVVSYTVNFTGSNTSRSITLQNMCYSCLGKSGSCTTCINSVGTYTTNTTNTLVVNNNSCEYDATSSYNYGSNPSYSTININNAGCTSAKVDISGNGVSYTTIQCLGITPTPIDLLSFNAVANNSQVDITFSTMTETNNKFFTIERSLDGENFIELTTINSKAIKGNSTEVLNYTATDASPIIGNLYYRLKQTDYNSSFKYFNVVPVNYSAPLNLAIYPNPAQNSFSIEPNTNTLQILQLFDINQNQVLLQTIQGKTTINISNLNSGVYNLNLSSSSGVVNKKIVIVK